MQFELNAVKKSDFVIANLCFSNSTGTNIEIYEAYSSGIPVLALVDDVHKQHPWVNEMVTRTFNDMDELLDYVNYYYLF
jgi:nucleoside 2-deoxyribosyltransferase